MNAMDHGMDYWSYDCLTDEHGNCLWPFTCACDCHAAAKADRSDREQASPLAPAPVFERPALRVPETSSSDRAREVIPFPPDGPPRAPLPTLTGADSAGKVERPVTFDYDNWLSYPCKLGMHPNCGAPSCMCSCHNNID